MRNRRNPRTVPLKISRRSSCGDDRGSGRTYKIGKVSIDKLRMIIGLGSIMSMSEPLIHPKPVRISSKKEIVSYYVPSRWKDVAGPLD